MSPDDGPTDARGLMKAKVQRATPVARRRRYQTLGWLLICAGWAAGAGGWVGVQSTEMMAVQLAYLASGGLAGIALVVMGVGLQNADDVRTSREILEDLQDRMEDLELHIDHLVGAVAGLPGAEGRGRR